MLSGNFSFLMNCNKYQFIWLIYCYKTNKKLIKINLKDLDRLEKLNKIIADVNNDETLLQQLVMEKDILNSLE